MGAEPSKEEQEPGDDADDGEQDQPEMIDLGLCAEDQGLSKVQLRVRNRKCTKWIDTENFLLGSKLNGVRGPPLERCTFHMFGQQHRASTGKQRCRGSPEARCC